MLFLLHSFYCSLGKIQTPSQTLPKPVSIPAVLLHSQALLPSLGACNSSYFSPCPAHSVEKQAAVLALLPIMALHLVHSLSRSSSVTFHATRRVSCFLYSVCKTTSISLYNGTYNIIIFVFMLTSPTFMALSLVFCIVAATPTMLVEVNSIPQSVG